MTAMGFRDDTRLGVEMTAMGFRDEREEISR